MKNLISTINIAMAALVFSGLASADSPKTNLIDRALTGSSRTVDDINVRLRGDHGSGASGQWQQVDDFGFSGPQPIPSRPAILDDVQKSQKFSSEKSSLVDMAKADKRTGMSRGDMQAYKDLNADLQDPFPTNLVRGPEIGVRGKSMAGVEHGRVGPVNHIIITGD